MLLDGEHRGADTLAPSASTTTMPCCAPPVATRWRSTAAMFLVTTMAYVELVRASVAAERAGT